MIHRRWIVAARRERNAEARDNRPVRFAASRRGHDAPFLAVPGDPCSDPREPPRARSETPGEKSARAPVPRFDRDCHRSLRWAGQAGISGRRGGSGTYVRAALPETTLESAAAVTGPPDPEVLSARGRLLAAQQLPQILLQPLSRNLQARPSGARHVSDRDLESPCAAGACAAGAVSNCLLTATLWGFPPLRAALAAYVSQARGVRCQPDQVVVTSGTQHSLDLVARLLLDPGDQVWMEDPGYAPVTSLLRSHGARVIGIPVDAQGLDCAAGRLRCPLARLAYVTPGCHFPLGMPMSHERRLKLLDWAAEAGAWIFEDDYDGLLRGDGRHQQALQNLDRTGCVIYSNSLNRMLFSSLRLGFLILPPAFIEPAAAALSITQRYQPTMDQATLTDFIAQGHFDRHMQRMRELYTERREALTAGRKNRAGRPLAVLRFASRPADHRLARSGHERSRGLAAHHRARH